MFVSEFIAPRIATELIEGLRYKLKILGMSLDGPTNVFGDNQLVINNATIPESPLKKEACSRLLSPCQGSLCGQCDQDCKGKY